MNIHNQLILIKNSKTKEFEDKTADISDMHYAGNQVAVTYLHSNKTYNYNSLDGAVIESQKLSVFDLLYSEYSDKLRKHMTLSKHVSEHKPENLMYSVIEEVLNLPEYSSFKCVLHVPLKSIVKDFTGLEDDEKKYAQNPWTHVDFLIFNKLDKEPVLVVEVDGHEYHKNNEKQLRRDAMKDKILEEINLPVLRVATNESGEKEKLMEMLDKVISMSG